MRGKREDNTLTIVRALRDITQSLRTLTESLRSIDARLTTMETKVDKLVAARRGRGKIGVPPT